VIYTQATYDTTPAPFADGVQPPASPEWNAAEVQIAYTGTQAKSKGGTVPIILLLLFGAALAFGQSDNTFYARSFPGGTVGTKVANAQAACINDASIPCIIIIDPTLAKWSTGVMPAPCAQCYWQDLRGGLASAFPSPGTFTNAASHCSASAFVNGANMSMFASTGPSNYTQDGLCGATIVPFGSMVSQSNGVSGMVDNYANGPAVTGGTAGMGGYFQIRQYGSNNTAWGWNAVGIILPGANNTILQNEIDFDNMGGTGATIDGIAINAPYWNAVPLVAYGIVVTKPGCSTPNFGTFPATGCPQWTGGFTSYVGAAQYALMSYEAGVGNSQPSQPILFASRNSGGSELLATQYLDAVGNFIFSIPGNYVRLPGIDGSVNPQIPNIATYGLGLHPAANGASTYELYGTDQTNTTVKWSIDDSGDFTLNSVKIGANTLIPATATGNTGNAVGKVVLAIAGTTGSIGGSALTAGNCASGTATIAGGTAGHPAIASPSDGTFIGGAYTVTATTTNATTVTVNVCTTLAAGGTPAAKTYNVLTF
jgi:hypothetical protein